MNRGKHSYEIDLHDPDAVSEIRELGVRPRKPAIAVRCEAGSGATDNLTASRSMSWPNVTGGFAGSRCRSGTRLSWLGHHPAARFMWAFHRPSVDEAVSRMMHLKERGASNHAFDWQMASAQLWKTARCAPAGHVA